MLEIVCLFVGLVGGGLIVAGMGRRRATTAAAAAEPTRALAVLPPPQPVETTPAVTVAPVEEPLFRLERAFAKYLVAESQAPLHSLANGIGRELADLATAVQGNAQLLCEVSSQPELVAPRCEFLWAGVDRLRLLTEKILTFARDARLERESIDVRAFLDDVRREIETVHGDLLAVHVATSSFLPQALGHRRSLHNALLFLVDTLLEMEPFTHSISIAAYADVSDDETTIGIELSAETGGEETPKPRPPKRALELGYLAAKRSLEAQGAQLWMQQVENLTSTCFITLDAETPTADVPAPDVAPSVHHEFGGVLVLEGNPSIRNMITTEVERLGRKPLSCVDAASARALLNATPERFELLVLEQDARNGDSLAIAREIAKARPEMKILLLGSVTESRVHDAGALLGKPFGLLELRDALESILAPSA